MPLLETEAPGWPRTIAFLAARAITGIEVVTAQSYKRAVVLNGISGILTVSPDDHGLAWQVAPDGPDANTVAHRLRRLFGLDRTADAARQHLSLDPDLAPLVARDPELRIPGCWDPFELAVRAVLGQQVSVAGARTMAGRLVAATGRALTLDKSVPRTAETDWFEFPSPIAVAEGDLSSIGLTRQRERTLRGVASAFVKEPDLLKSDGDIEDLVKRLVELPGIGPWTAHYMALRGARHPDAFPSSDLGLLRAMAKEGVRPSPKELEAKAEAWRPFRAHAAQYLWTKDAV